MPAEISPDDVMAKPDSAPPETATEDTTELPGPVLKIPAVHALLQGSPPAFFVDGKTKDPDIKTLEKHAKELNQAGIGAFPAQSKPGNVVVYNGLVLPADEIMKADQAGKLDEIAVSWDQLKAAYESKTTEESTPSPVSAAGVPTGEPVPSGVPLSSGAQNKLLQKRVANLTLETKPPTSAGSKPGAGRILNAITQTAL